VPSLVVLHRCRSVGISPVVRSVIVHRTARGGGRIGLVTCGLRWCGSVGISAVVRSSVVNRAVSGRGCLGLVLRGSRSKRRRSRVGVAAIVGSPVVDWGNCGCLCFVRGRNCDGRCGDNQHGREKLAGLHQTDDGDQSFLAIECELRYESLSCLLSWTAQTEPEPALLGSAREATRPSVLLVNSRPHESNPQAMTSRFVSGW
jgi:hypothetical protein